MGCDLIIDFLLDVFEKAGGYPAIIFDDKQFSYSWLHSRIIYWKKLLEDRLPLSKVVVLKGDFSPESISLFFALIEHKTIVIPLTKSTVIDEEKILDLTDAEFLLEIIDGNLAIEPTYNYPKHTLINSLQQKNIPGLILFSSGTTGEPKAIIHDLSRLLEKFRIRGKSFTTISFMLFDHIGGLDTMLYTLSNGSTLVTLIDRSPEFVCKMVEKNNVEVLPVTPTFLNLFLLSDCFMNYDLSSLRIITYGTEVMPETTLERCVKLFPNVRFIQKFGTSEIGALRSKSLSSYSTWVKLGGENVQIRVVDNILQIKTNSAMLGYLNAPSPFTEDGWFITGDIVEVDGDYLKFLGRQSEIINIGGLKVFPAEVENVIIEMDEISDVKVYGEKNAILGNIVCADVVVYSNALDNNTIQKRIYNYCLTRVDRYKIPMKIKVCEKLFNDRYKKEKRV